MGCQALKREKDLKGDLRKYEVVLKTCDADWEAYDADHTETKKVGRNKFQNYLDKVEWWYEEKCNGRKFQNYSDYVKEKDNGRKKIRNYSDFVEGSTTMQCYNIIKATNDPFGPSAMKHLLILASESGQYFGYCSSLIELKRNHYMQI